VNAELDDDFFSLSHAEIRDVIPNRSDSTQWDCSKFRSKICLVNLRLNECFSFASLYKGIPQCRGFEDIELEDLEDRRAVDRAGIAKRKIAFTRVRVETQDEFTQALEKFKPDVILSDHSLPQLILLPPLPFARRKS